MKLQATLTLLSITFSFLSAKSNTELLGDVLAFAIPATAYGTTLYTQDTQGQEEFYKAYGSTLGTAVALKYMVNEERPDKSNNRSFPSGHTASAISGATFIHKKYGFKYAVLPYLGAIYTGYSRVHSDKHFTHDVLAGALIGGIASWYFVSPYKNVDIQPMVGTTYQGIKIAYYW